MLKILRSGLLVAIFITAAQYSVAGSDSTGPNDSATSKSPPLVASGTEDAPIVVTRPAGERRGEDFDRASHAANEHRIVLWTGALAVGTFCLAIFTALLWWENRRLIRETTEGSVKSLREAERSADALQSVGQAMKDNTENMERVMHQQMRAYIAVEPGMPIYQDRRFKFGSKPEIINTGYTPARNVRYRLHSGVLNFPPAPQHVFPDTAPFSTHDATLSPRQKFITNTAANVDYSDADVAEIMKGQTKAVHLGHSHLRGCVRR